MKLFEPLTIGRLTLKNRVVMPPMTRSRAHPDGVQPEIAETYYAQRAGAGLIVSEGTQPSAQGQGYCRTPGIHTDEQIRAWRKVTDAVHAAGGLIFLQLMHIGRIGHSLNRTVASPLVSASAIPAGAKIYTDQQGMLDMETPEALTIEGIGVVVDQYARATRNAFEAGFDGAELHGASGYLPMQFLSPNSNVRTDIYGGPVENRARFLLEALDAMIVAAGDAKLVGVRLSPGVKFNGMNEPDPASDYPYVLGEIERRDIGYVNVHLEPTFLADRGPTGEVEWLRTHYKGTLMAAGRFTKDSAEQALERGWLDAVGFGSLFTSNPDLPERLRRDLPLTPPNPALFYSPGPEGYIDFPAATA